MPAITHPLLLAVPERFETERLLVRAPRPGDGPPLAEAVAESWENARPWVRWVNRARTPEDAEVFVREAARAFAERKNFTLLIVRKRDSLLCGQLHLHGIDWAVPKFEIGFWLRVSAQGKGCMTEAVSGLTRWCFQVFTAQRLEIFCDTRNRRSIAVAENCGYRRELVLRRAGRSPLGELVDMAVYSKLPEDD